jgi:hypothetical protein
LRNAVHLLNDESIKGMLGYFLVFLFNFFSVADFFF